MKKSKLMKALLVFGMSMVTATSIVGFTACGDEHDHVDEDNNGKCDICDNDMPTDGGEQGGGETVTVAVEKVELNKGSLTLDIGDEETLTATVTPENADNKTVTWSSDKPDIATVSNSGKVTAKAAGTATITATAGGKSATCSVTVNEPVPQPEVTKEEWAEILESVHNFTLTKTTGSNTYIQKVDGDKIGLADGSILAKDGEKYYEYHLDAETEKWVKVEILSQQYEGTASVFSGFVSGIKDLYEEFDLDEGVYVAKHAIDMPGVGELQNLEVTFNHGKLTGLTFETVLELSGGDIEVVPTEGETTEQADEPTEGGGETTGTPTEDPTENLIISYYEVSSVGTTTVELPKIEGEETPDPDENTVTAEEWAEILGGATSVTVEMGLEGQLESTLKTDGVKVHLISADNETIFAESEGSYYKYEKTDGKWSKEEITQEAYASELEEDNAYLAVLKSLNTDYESFTYADGKYTASEIVKDEFSMTINNIEVTFDNGALVSVKFEVSELELTYGNVNSTTIDVPTVSKVPNITEWAEVTDATYVGGDYTIEVEGNPTLVDTIYHHIFLNDAVAPQYDFDSYEATVKLDGEDGIVVSSQSFGDADKNAHTYHMHIRVVGNKYQTAVFTINFKKDGEVVATGTYTRVGDREIVLNDDTFNISKDATEPTSVSVLKVNGKTDLTGLKISWSISDTSVATIVDNENGTVSVTGVAVGTATLTCTVGEGENAFNTTCTITVVKGEVKDEDPVDVSDDLHEQETYGQWNIAIRLDCDAALGDKIESVEVTATMDGEATNVVVHEVYGGGAAKYVKLGVSKDWSHEYVFTINYKSQAGKVIATGTFTKAVPPTLTLDNTTLNLTLKDGETVTGTITATTQKVEGEVQWSIDNEDVATITVNDDGTVTVTAVAKGSATITATVGGLTQTCKVNVLKVGEEAPVITITKFSIFEGPYGENYYKFIFAEDDPYVDEYADIKASYEHTNVNGESTVHKEFYQGGGAKTYIATVKFNAAPISGTTYKIDLCDASNNILATFSWTAP